MEMNFASLWEKIAEIKPNSTALVHKGRRISWQQYNTRAAKLAQFLHQQGVGKETKVAIYTYNSSEYIEAQYAAFKLRAVAINVNYRYLEKELVYLLDNSDAEILFFHSRFADRIKAIRKQLPKLKCVVQIEDGADIPLLEGAYDYETIIKQADSYPPIKRSADDLYMLYTGGTTGMPKGVMYKTGVLCRTLFIGFERIGLSRPTNTQQVLDCVIALDKENAAPISLPVCPLMHGTGMWLGAMAPLNMGGTVVTLPNTSFDAHEMWKVVEQEKVSYLIIVGDAFAHPMLDALNEAQELGNPYDISSVEKIISSGVMWSQENKIGLLEHGDMALIDNLGASEGALGRSYTSRKNIAKTSKFKLADTSKVFNDAGKEVKPGSGEVGKLANGGMVPIAYYKDPQKSAEVFKVFDGKNYSLPGDYATVEADGSIKLLGRGSLCINTMGEKVYPEEVEEAIKTHPAVYDCLVVGIKDQKFGERVTAVASLKNDTSVDPEEIIDYLKSMISGYKKPKNLFIVDKVERAVNGKANYQWAKTIIEQKLNSLP